MTNALNTLCGGMIISAFLFVSCTKHVPGKDLHGTTGGETDTAATPWTYSTPWPFDQPSVSSLHNAPKKVFAHYMTQFPISIDNNDPASDYYKNGYLNPNGEGGIHLLYGGYLRNRPIPRAPRTGADWMEQDMEEEVRRASAIGIDGFAVDLLAYSGYHYDRVIMLLEAAHRVDPEFSILLMPDMTAAFKNEPEKLKTVIQTLSAYPAAYRLSDNRLVVSPFLAENQTATWWGTWKDTMHLRGVEVALLPVFQGWQNFATAFAPISYGMSDWGWRSPGKQASWLGVPAQAKAYGPIWMMPVAPQDMRPREQRYFEAANSEEFRVMWKNAIDGGADWVQLITWNDYAEHTVVAPSTGTQYAFYDLAAYYVTWFKTGAAPAITRDVLYYFYRQHATTAPNQQSKPFVPDVNGSDAPLDEIELLAFLQQAGTLEIEIGGVKTQQNAAAGMNSFRIPLVTGKPVFRLKRNDDVVINLPGAFEIKSPVEYQNLLYCGGSNSRAPVQ